MKREVEERLSEESIKRMDAGELVVGAMDIFELDDVSRAIREAWMRIRAKALGIEDIFSQIMKDFKATDKKYAREAAKADDPIGLEMDEKGRPQVSINNFLRIMRRDPAYACIRHNLLTDMPEKADDSGKTRCWTDTDDAGSMCYIEHKYGIYAKDKHAFAFLKLLEERAYHPVREIIDGITWDGQPRVETFLHRVMRCEDTPYTREVSRLIFAGGIRRIYEPGCKFDDMAVLIGTRQGEGKSTIVRWLAMQDRFFREVSEFEGQKGMEALDGAWICEVGELLALTKAKEQEAIKAYLTRQVDSYRKPYARRVSESARQCIFIGTTNKEQFLKDKTGGRRFFPVRVHSRGVELFGRETEIRAEIAQCWAEARARMLAGDFPAHADAVLEESIRAAQEDALEDDYRIGMIAEYLEGKDSVCGIELWEKALHNPFMRMGRRNELDIALIMQGFDGWERSSKRAFTPQYGRQRLWERKSVAIWTEDHIPF